jgi:hypothetical protein
VTALVDDLVLDDFRFGTDATALGEKPHVLGFELE